MKRIAQGENALIRRNLVKTDGSALLLSTLTLLQAEIMQNGTVIETVTYPSAKLRQGGSTSQAELEVVVATSLKFKKGRVSVRWTVTAASAIFTSDLIQKDIITEDILEVI